MAKNTLAGTSSNWWCEFNPSFLKVVCHGANPPTAECSLPTARCLKRASQTGGCTAIAKAIRCRALQAEHDADNLNPTALDVRAQGCEPCLLLPFQPVPRSCSDDIRREPAEPR